MRYFIKLAYNGSTFHGWQSQPNAISVQQTVEEALTTLLRCQTPVTGAGRTDTGVNARIMYAHFDAERHIEDKNKFVLSMNRLCGRNIAIYDIIQVDDGAHARFDASQREYRYFITFKKSPFLPFSWFYPSDLNIGKMNEAAEVLTHTSDFTSFAKLHSDARTNICDVRRAEWRCWENDYHVPGVFFIIAADRFLRNMVRAVVGTLVDVGRGKIDLNEFKDIIEAKNRCAAGTSMPPEALFLWDIQYPFINNDKSFLH